MANVLAHLSSILIPAVIFFIIGYGWIHKCNLYDDFINGAADGLKTVVGIVPTLIGLMMAVGILRGSGLLDLLMSCTETCFYTMSVYFMTARVSKSRYTLAGALLSTAVGVVMSVLLAYLM